MRLTTRLMCCAAVLVLSSAVSAADGPRLVTGDDRAGAGPRMAAAAFLTSLADADAEGARALFAGPGEQLPLLAAEARYAKAADRLKAALAALPALPAFLGGKARDSDFNFLRMSATVALRRLVVLNGDEASLSGGSMLDFPIELRRIDGKWRVTDALGGRERPEAFRKFLDDFVAAADAVAAKAEAKQFRSADAALASFNQRFAATMEAWLLKDPERAPPPEPTKEAGGAAQQAAARQAAPPTARELAGAIGQPLMSPAGTALIASLPATPRVIERKTGLFILCHAAGIELTCIGDGLPVTMVVLHAGGEEGFARYGGQLPRGLEWSDRRRDVERKLGRPVASGGGERVGQYRATYDEAGAETSIDVAYAKESARDPDNPMRQVNLFARKPSKAAPDPRPGPRPGLELRLVEATVAPPPPPKRATWDGVNTFPDPNDPMGELVLSLAPAVLLDETAVETVRPVSTARNIGEVGKFGIGLRMTEAGARKLADVTAKNVGRRIGIVIEGRLISAPTIRTPIGRDVLIEGGANDDKQEMRTLCDRLHAAVFALRE